MSRHRDRYDGIAVAVEHPDYKTIRERIDAPDRLDYYRERSQYDEGRDNGYAYITAEHDDGECERFAPGDIRRIEM